MVFRRMSYLLATAVVSFCAFAVCAFGQSVSRNESGSAELVTGPARIVDTPADRDAIVQLLARVRNSYALQGAGRGYDLKVAFTANSLGQTQYDGAWTMEDLFDPRQGLRWTASAAAGFTVTRISSSGTSYSEGTTGPIPLRLQEARAALFDPIPSASNVKRQSIRTSTVARTGATLTCVLLSGSGNAANAAAGRRWDETEECIDPASGLLQVHSQVPGRYYAYDYTNALRSGNRVLPGKVTVTEAGRVVSTISVESLTDVAGADPSLFVPTQEMKTRGRAIALEQAQKVFTVLPQGDAAPGVTARAVCVFGLVTASGQLVEAHSLQPEDPDSQMALDAVKRMKFSAPAAPGAQPQQHFVFVIGRFVAPPAMAAALQ
jgi:hypothetical protein